MPNKTGIECNFCCLSNSSSCKAYIISKPLTQNKTANEKKDAFDRKLDEAISTMSYKADDIIDKLERKLEDLKAKNAQLNK